MSGVPARIKRDAAAADEALKNFTAPAEPATPPEGSTPEPVTPPATPHAAPELTPITPPTPAPTPIAAAPIDAAAFAELQQRMNTLQGMFNQSQAENQQLIGKTETLTKLLAQRAPSNDPTPPAPAAPTPMVLVSAQDKEEYGEDLLRVIKAAAAEGYMPAINQLLGRIERMENSLKQTNQTANVAHEFAAQTAQEKFVAELTRLVPDYEVLDTHPPFLDWLAKRDMFTGVERIKLLRQASEAGDAERTASFFLAFKNESGHTAAPPATVTPPSAPAAAAPSAPKVDPMSLIAPGQAGSSTPSTSGQNGKIWSSDEIAKVYDDYQKGILPKDEFLKLEVQIFAAYAEGRTKD